MISRGVGEGVRFELCGLAPTTLVPRSTRMSELGPHAAHGCSGPGGEGEGRGGGWVCGADDKHAMLRVSTCVGTKVARYSPHATH